MIMNPYLWAWNVLFLIVIGEAYPQSERLRHALFDSYSKTNPPTNELNQSVDVSFGIVNKQLVSVDIQSMTMKMFLWTRLIWTDESLIWNPDDFDGITRVNINPADIWIFSIVAATESIQNASIQYSDKLFYSLLNDYPKMSRPRQSLKSTVDVQFGVVLKQLLRVDIHAQTMKMFLWQRVKWNDDLMRWDPNDFGGIDRIQINAAKIWTPDVIFQNSLEDYEQLREVSILKSLITYKGLVLYFTPQIRSTTCKMNVLLFPYDSQICKFVVGTWMSSKAEVNLSHLSFSSNLEDFMEHPEWKLTKMWQDFTENTILVDLGGLHENQTFQTLEFWYEFSRKPGFYEKNIIIPTALIAFTGLVTFVLPNECGEKLSFSVTIFLSLCVNLVVISTYVPPTSENYPLIGKYYIFCIFIVAASLLQTSIILSLHYIDRNNVKRPPLWLRQLFRIMAPFVCMTIPSEEANKKYCQVNGETDVSLAEIKSSQNKLDLLAKDNCSPTVESALAQIVKKLNDDNNKDCLVEEWQNLSRILDRVTALVFFLASFIGATYFYATLKGFI